MGHGENAARVMAEAGGELSGKVRRDGCGRIIGVAQAGVTALDEETGDDAILGKARINGLYVFCFASAFGEADKVGAHERCAGEKSSVVKVPRGVVNSSLSPSGRAVEAAVRVKRSASAQSAKAQSGRKFFIWVSASK
jgi:hypothetical protein